MGAYVLDYHVSFDTRYKRELGVNEVGDCVVAHLFG